MRWIILSLMQGFITKNARGWIFNPVTDRGKARLELAETMIRRTDKTLKENKTLARDNGLQL